MTNFFSIERAPSAAALTTLADPHGEPTCGAGEASDETRKTLLRVRDLTVQLGSDQGAGVPVVAGISFDVAAGEAVGIMGESGCGKTTTALSLLRLLPKGGRITSGSIEFAGGDLASATERNLERIRGAEISMIFQEPGISLHPTMRVGNQVSEVIHAHRGGTWKQSRKTAAAGFEQVFPEDAQRIYASYPHELSGGQQQRVLIAQALACRPALVIADEPTASLDTTTQAEILALIRECQQRLGLALLLISHNPAILAELADRILVMYAGRIVEEGPIESVFQRPLHPYTERLLRSIPRPAHDGPAPGKQKLPAILGNPPDLACLLPGCPFEPRCADRMDICATREPEEVQPEALRRVRCFKYGG